jgi:hypothetical protein
LFGSLFGRSKSSKEDAGLRRGLKEGEVSALGPSMKSGLSKVGSVKVVCYA